MKRAEFVKIIESRVLTLDGAYGTEFFKSGYGNHCTDELNLSHPEVVLNLQKKYVQAGADILLTNTFNANPLKLDKLGLTESFEQINKQAVRIGRQAIGNKNCFLFGNLSSCGDYIEPFGQADFEQVVQAFAAQAKLLAELGVSGFVLETVSDLAEYKAAVVGIRSVCPDLPLVAKMTFEADGVCTTGTRAEIFAALAQDLDVDVVGVNCSTGPKEMVENIKRLKKYTNKPLSVEPNAGDPVLRDGDLVYLDGPESFAPYIADFVDLGVVIIGGCCGTDARHIATIKQLTQGKKPRLSKEKVCQAITSRTVLCEVEPFLKIAERINPAGNENFQKEIADFDFERLKSLALSQAREGADILDVNLGIEKILQKEHFSAAMRALDKINSLPISIDVQASKNMEVAARHYMGRPLLNSIRVTPKALENKAKILQRYGGMVVLLAMDKKFPQSVDDALRIVEQGVGYLEQHGIDSQRVLVDPLLNSIATGSLPENSLKLIQKLHERGLKTTCGLSNISFGMPSRGAIESAFLAQAVGKGLSSAIMEVAKTQLKDVIVGSLYMQGKKLTVSGESEKRCDLTGALLQGDKILADKLVDEALQTHSALEVAEKVLAQSMREIGQLFARKKIYLPELMLASQTAEPIFGKLTADSDEGASKEGKIMLATVKGDIHSIGKQIIGTILKGAGFEVIDIGQDLDKAVIASKVREHSPDILGLSAMMTTTVGQVEATKKYLLEQGLACPVISGGSSMTKELAESYGCHYCKDASDVVELALALVNVTLPSKAEETA